MERAHCGCRETEKFNLRRFFSIAVYCWRHNHPLNWALFCLQAVELACNPIRTDIVGRLYTVWICVDSSCWLKCKQYAKSEGESYIEWIACLNTWVFGWNDVSRSPKSKQMCLHNDELFLIKNNSLFETGSESASLQCTLDERLRR